MSTLATKQTIHKPPFFNDVHSFMQNLMAELSRTREQLDHYESWHQQSCDKIRKELEQERFESRESMNKFRYEFDELVHKRVETVLEGLEEMEQNQKFKDRQQQHQLDTLETEMQSLKGNLGHVNSQWTRFKHNSKKRSRLTQPIKKKEEPDPPKRDDLGTQLHNIQKEKEENHMYRTAELMRIRLKGAAQFLKGEEWERVIRDVDVDQSGQIGFMEFRKLCREDLRVMEPDSQLRVVFDSLDSDGSGEISVDELLEYVSDPSQRMRHRLNKAASKTGHDWTRLLRELDQDKSGQINFLEFRSLCRDKLKMLDKDVQLQAVFNGVDADHSGEISIKELTAWVGRPASR